jgi:DNA-binding response OmpR family regulator
MVSIRVLLADPDESLLSAYHEYLGQDGFEVATVTNGLDCVAQLRRFQPDVLILEPESCPGAGATGSWP